MLYLSTWSYWLLQIENKFLSVTKYVLNFPSDQNYITWVVTRYKRHRPKQGTRLLAQEAPKVLLSLDEYILKPNEIKYHGCFLFQLLLIFLKFWREIPWQHIPPGPILWKARGSPGLGSLGSPCHWAGGGTELATPCLGPQSRRYGGGRISSWGCLWARLSGQSISTRDKTQMENPSWWNWRRQ